MNIEIERYRITAASYVNAHPDSSPDEILAILAHHFKKDYIAKEKVYYNLMCYFACKYEDSLAINISSVANDCIMAEYNRQKGIEI